MSATIEDLCAEQDSEHLREQFTNHYLADRAATFARIWDEWALDGDERAALATLWVDGDPTEAYRVFDALMSSLIEQRVQHHLAHGTEPRGF